LIPEAKILPLASPVESHAQPARPFAEGFLAAFEDLTNDLADVGVFQSSRRVGE
jgi:hypothetical protein